MADWECIRGTSYIYPNTPLSRRPGQGLRGRGLRGGAARQHRLQTTGRPARSRATTRTSSPHWQAKYPSLDAPVTNRTHCIAWSDWATQPKVELAERHKARHQLLLLAGELDPGPPRHVHRLGDADALRRHRRHDDRRLPGHHADDRRVAARRTRSTSTRCSTRRTAPRATTAPSPPTCTPTKPEHAGANAIVNSAKPAACPSSPRARCSSGSTGATPPPSRT